MSPEPAHYAFAYAVLVAPNGPLAAQVARLTDGGCRLTREDMVRLSGGLSAGAPAAESERRQPQLDQAERLVAETQAQVDDFAAIVRTMRRETNGFGRDLAQSAAAINEATPVAVADLSRITGVMIARAKDSETKLALATDETERLRTKLAEACETARRDPLTGLANRLAFAEAYATRKPDQGPYCLALCDIDHFKRVNDVHGHGVGDRVLKMIGHALVENCNGQLVTRYGGEEFAILIKGMKLTDATKMIDRARKTIANRRLRNRDTDAPIGAVTFSAGIVAVGTHESAEEATDRADKLLYNAKSLGRDRVCAG
ncbi:GGDEF domain-containing protein [Sphingomonas mollis]|uniref:GGDEF domain-containing protein n=1 Tax=Sphingomonas mollis TaxID=2795726 RepID=UPI001E2C5101|nr:GGDEF domain-containing protein [Sphingomonas sp. BT553]